MSTYLIKPKDVQRNWHIIDASGKTLGRVATLCADLLRGKHKVDFTPHVDCGDHVIVINCEKMVLTGNKLTQKTYYHHTGHVGGIKAVTAKDLMQKKPEHVMQKAVKGMLPDTTIGRKALTRLRTFRDDQHNHQSQKPVPWQNEIK